MKVSRIEHLENRNSERGSSSLKFLFAILVLVLIGYAGYSYIPTAYNGQSLKEEMRTAVINGMAASGRNKPEVSIKKRLNLAFKTNNIPADAILEVKKVGEVVQARVSYTKKIDILPFGLYQYDYIFDHTARPTGF